LYSIDIVLVYYMSSSNVALL